MEQLNLKHQNVIIASGPVIIEDGKVLLNKHGEKNFWKFPGGDVYEKTGTLEEWAVRRAQEEMGLEIELIRPLKPMAIWGEEETIILIHYLARRTSEKLEPADFIREHGWFNIDNLPADCAPNIKPVIEEYLKNK